MDFEKLSKLYKYCEKSDYKIFEDIIEETKNYLDHNDWVLEIGCGDGDFSFDLSYYVNNYVATDYNSNVINKAFQKKSYISRPPDALRFQHTDVYNIPFDDKTFDKVLAFNTLHILYDPKGAISEIKRVLKDDGQIIFAGYLRKTQIKHNLKTFVLNTCGCKIHNYWNREEFLNFLQENELMIENYKTYHGNFEIILVILKKHL